MIVELDFVVPSLPNVVEPGEHDAEVGVYGLVALVR
jgi:hypothetical protein